MSQRSEDILEFMRKNKGNVKYCYNCVSVMKGYHCSKKDKTCTESRAINWDCKDFILAPVNYWKNGHPCDGKRWSGHGVRK